MKTFIIDTNVLLSSSDSVFDVLDGDIFIPLVCINEIDRQKEFDGELGYKARRAKNKIHSLITNETLFNGVNYNGKVVKSIYEQSSEELPFPLNAYNLIDDAILKTCLYLKDLNPILVTNDLGLGNKASSLNILTQKFNTSETTTEYTGYKRVFYSEDTEAIIAEHYQNKEKNIFNLYSNQYLIIYDENMKPDIERWNGSKFEKLTHKKFAVKPKNELQACALDLLCNRNIPIKIIIGTFGSGKTYLATQQILKFMEEQEYYKWVLSRQATGDMDSAEVGFLRGDYLEKTEPFFKPIFDNIDGGIFKMQEWIQQGRLEYVIPYYMKGRSFSGDTCIYVDESEDLTLKTLKMIGSRVGESDKEIGNVIFTGDYNQVESKYKHNNGLIHLINNTKDNPLVGIVMLEDDVRSKASKVFANL